MPSLLQDLISGVSVTGGMHLFHWPALVYPLVGNQQSPTIEVDPFVTSEPLLTHANRICWFHRRAGSLAVLVSFLVCGCTSLAVPRHFAPKGAELRALNYLELFTRSQHDSAEAMILPALRNAETHRAVAQVNDILAGQHIDSVRETGIQVRKNDGVVHTNVDYEFHASSGWMLGNVATVDSDGTWFVEAFTITPIKRSMEAVTAFTFRGHSPVNYIWLVATTLCVGLSLGTAAFIAFGSGMPKRWKWVVASLVGVGACNLNWVTGETSLREFQLQLFAGGVMRVGPIGPWIFTFAFPIGAIIALERYRRWRALTLEDTDNTQALRHDTDTPSSPDPGLTPKM